MDKAKSVSKPAASLPGALWKRTQTTLDGCRAPGASSGFPDMVEAGVICKRLAAKAFLGLFVLGVLFLRGVYLSSLAGSSSSDVPALATHGRTRTPKSTPTRAKVAKKLLKSNAEVIDDSIEYKGVLSSSWWSHSDDLAAEQKPAPQTLVLYIFSNTDPEYIDNLRFYVRTAIKEDDGCHHVIVINSGSKSPEVDMPELPSNAKYLHHANECYDWGTFGWALEHEKVQVRDYKYFIFLNSSVRGPFLPPYLQGKVHFSELMTRMLNHDDAPNSIKLVGPSVSCEGTVRLAGGLQRSNPHVQSFAVATEQTGMQLLMDDGKVFGCYDNIDETIYHSELGSSNVILRAGYNIASFMSRYQGVNWLDEKNWHCSDGENPFNWGAVDIYSLQPMELMFVKVKNWAVKRRYPSMLQAKQYDEWSAAAAKGEQNLSKKWLNPYKKDLVPERVLKMAAKGPECWDCAYYKANNFVARKMTCFKAFSHFVNHGQFDPETAFRFTCETVWAEHGVPFNADSFGGTRGWPIINETSCEAPLKDKNTFL